MPGPGTHSQVEGKGKGCQVSLQWWFTGSLHAVTIQQSPAPTPLNQSSERTAHTSVHM
jgi:murein endopeptidase